MHSFFIFLMAAVLCWYRRQKTWRVKFVNAGLVKRGCLKNMLFTVCCFSNWIKEFYFIFCLDLKFDILSSAVNWSDLDAFFKNSVWKNSFLNLPFLFYLHAKSFIINDLLFYIIFLESFFSNCLAEKYLAKIIMPNTLKVKLKFRTELT